MEYSELIQAFQQNDQPKVNRLLKQITPRLIRFLVIHLDADQQDAEDCAQEAILIALKVIKEGKLRNEDRILSFLLSTCRNNYLNWVKKNKTQSYENFSGKYDQKPRQLNKILDKEQHQLLQWCIEQLSERYRSFIDYWFTYPDSQAKVAAAHFDTTVNNVWTRKHRVIKKLKECYQQKINN